MKRAVGDVRGISYSRRILKKDGTLTEFNRNLSCDEVADWGTNDWQVGVLYFERPDDTPGISLVNFACHPVTVQVQPLISADFPGEMAAFVERADVGCSDCIYLQGACGDINPIQHSTTDFSYVRRYGCALAGEVIKQLSILSAPDYPVAPVSLVAGIRTVTVPSREVPAVESAEAEYRTAKDSLQCAGTKEEWESAKWSLLKPEEVFERARRGDAPISVEIQAFRIGDTILVGIPGEPFCELGLQLKGYRNDGLVFCVGYANGYYGYIAPPEAWHRGGYEVSLGTWSIVGPQAFNIVLDIARSLIDVLR